MISLSRPSSRRPEGFSLMELLVAITVVVMLAGLLLPAVGSMLNRGKEAGSISNLQSIAHGVASYVADNNGRFPAGYYLDAKPPYWCESITAYISAAADTNRFQNIQARPFVVCEKFLDPMLKNGRHSRLGDYGGNHEFFRSPDNAPTQGTAQQPLAAAAISSPSRKVMVVPAEQTHASGGLIGSWMLDTYVYVNQGTNTPPNISVPSDRGTKRVQCLFADGHIEAIAKSTLTANRRDYFIIDP